MKKLLKMSWLLVALVATMFMVACGGGGGGSSSPAVQTISTNVAVPTSLFDDGNPSLRASIKVEAASITVKVTAWSDGVKKNDLGEFKTAKTTNNGTEYFVASIKGLEQAYDYRFAAIFNQKEILSNIVGAGKVSDKTKVDYKTTLKTIAYEAFKAKSNDKSVEHFVESCKESGITNVDTGFSSATDEAAYKANLVKLTNNQITELPKAVVTETVKESVKFAIVADKGIIVNNLASTTPTFTVSCSPEFSFNEQAQTAIKDAISVSTIASSKVSKKWNGNVLKISFTEALAYSTKYTISMSEVKDLDDVIITKFNAFEFTTVAEQKQPETPEVITPTGVDVSYLDKCPDTMLIRYAFKRIMDNIDVIRNYNPSTGSSLRAGMLSDDLEKYSIADAKSLISTKGTIDDFKANVTTNKQILTDKTISDTLVKTGKLNMIIGKKNNYTVGLLVEKATCTMKVRRENKEAVENFDVDIKVWFILDPRTNNIAGFSRMESSFDEEPRNAHIFRIAKSDDIVEMVGQSFWNSDLPLGKIDNYTFYGVDIIADYSGDNSQFTYNIKAHAHYEAGTFKVDYKGNKLN